MESVSVPYEELFSTTVVSNEGGQSVIELLVMLPLLLALTLLVVKINTAIQISIVNQKYARGRTLFLAHNSPVYPSRFKGNGTGNGLAVTELEEKGYNRMVVGVSANPISEEEGSTTPVATTFMVARSRNTATGSNEDKAEPDRRSLVRVRTTVALCTPSWVVQGGNNFVPTRIAQDTFGSNFSPAAYAYCRSPRDE
jgi:hypothetical protein